MSTMLLDRPRLTVPVSERDHVIGRETAPVTLLEYGDYECPYCAAAQPNVKQALSALGDDVRFAYRHFPLAQIHPHAALAAEAAEAAGAQGRFWEMHELLFANQQRLGPRDLLVDAERLGLDLNRFARDLDEHTFRPKVREDFMSGVRSGVNGTPTFFVNGVRHNGGYSAEELVEAIESEL
jgi:protein-disulfide isomerase